MSPRTPALVLSLLCALSLPAHAITLGIPADEFQFQGDWAIQQAPRGVTLLFADKPTKALAATAVQIPKAGQYQLWVRSIDFPHDRPGTRTFKVTVAGKPSPQPFGKSGQADWSWEKGGLFDLPAGPALITLAGGPFARVNAVLLTDDPKFTPTGRLGLPNHPRSKPIELPVPDPGDRFAAPPVTAPAGDPAARLENEFLRVEFLRAKRGDQDTVAPRVSVKNLDNTWSDAAADPSAEAYTAVVGPADATLAYAGFFPRWKGGPASVPFTVEAGGAKALTARGDRTHAIWDAGAVHRFVPRAARASGNKVTLDFHPNPAGTLTAEWELHPGERAARVKLSLTPAAPAQYALGYHPPIRRPIAEVDELLLPLQWQRKRFPNRAQTILDPVTPTPISLMQIKAPGATAKPLTWALIGDPAHLSFAWPNPDKPHFGLNIRDDAGRVQPSLYGPVPGTDAAKSQPGKTVDLSLRVLATPQDWYGAYRFAADDVFGLRDYRSNVGTSLTDAALNMVDLLKHDHAGGWWERGKGFIQIETKNGVTQSAPLLPMSVYRLSGDDDLFRRRALPTLQFLLSRTMFHFSPIPDDTGVSYPAGGMDGPIRAYAGTVYGAMWDLLGRPAGAVRDTAFGPDALKPTGHGHAQAFDEHLSRYMLTGDTAALTKARELADHYIANHVTKPPAQDLGTMPFFFISFVPNWEGLLQLYEVTRENRYLEAAAFGARQLMTGVWTQPTPPAGDFEIHPTGQFPGDTLHSWRQEKQYRLGTPRKPNDTPKKTLPAWVVSNVGLSFEQPSTIRGRNQDRLIYQMNWAPGFLRLARHTGDKTFETYARNATLGRFANYSGYYATGFTDLPLNPKYPYDGPDVTDFYYHHIPVHLMWTIDYLFADVELKSAGKIAFPFHRQIGYAYFDNRVFGHAPGTVYDQKDVWPWLRRGLVTLDNPQVNYLPARAGNQFFVVLTNQDHQPQTVNVRFLPDVLKFDPTTQIVSTITADGQRSQATLTNATAKVTLPAKGLLVLQLDGIRADVTAVHTLPANPAEPKPAAEPAIRVTKTDLGFAIKSTALTAPTPAGDWNAYIWLTATPKQLTRATLHHRTGTGDWQSATAAEYPFEFSIPMPKDHPRLEFKLDLQTPDGKTTNVPATTLNR